MSQFVKDCKMGDEISAARGFSRTSLLDFFQTFNCKRVVIFFELRGSFQNE